MNKCIICGNDNWENLDKLRDYQYWYDKNFRYDEPIGFKICKHCAYVTYEVNVKNHLQHYDSEREYIGTNNIVTTNRKKEYHKKFLDDALTAGHIKDIHNFRVLDVGMAHGYTLECLNEYYNIPKPNLYGTEYASASKNYAKNIIGLNNVFTDVKDIEKNVKFDLIIMYHVLEHVENPLEKLIELKNRLTDKGVLYLSNPIWFDTLEEASGSMCIDFENLYHLNHCNVFSNNTYYNLMNKAGLEIITEENRVYGKTVLARKNDAKMKESIPFEDYKKIIEKLEKQKLAIDFLNKKEYDNAIEVYRNFPDAYILKSLHFGNVKEFTKQIDILRAGKEACKDNLKILDQIAVIHLQWDENTHNKVGYYSNNIKTAERLFNESLAIKTNEQNLFCLGIIESKYKKNHKKAVEYMRECMRINPNRYGECQNFIGQFASKEW